MVIIFYGIPGCGKTTIAKKLTASLRNPESARRAATVKLFISDKLKPPVYQKFFQLFKENAGKADFLIFDATFYKRKWREKMKLLARRSQEKVITVYVRCDLKTALQRNRRRMPKIPEKAVHIIFHQFESPKKPDIIINSEKTTAEQAAQKIFAFIRKRLYDFR